LSLTRLPALASVSLLALLSLTDLLSPPISPTISRQTQTYAQTAHFVESGFAFEGLTIDIDGAKPFHLAYEFPLYQTIVGVLFAAFGFAFIWGKLVSLAAALISVGLFAKLVSQQYPETVARRAALFMASSPITLLVSTAFQPDALAVAFGAGAAMALILWRQTQTLARWLVFLLLLLAAALAKFVVLVPFIPFFIALLLWHGRQWRKPTLPELVLGLFVVVVPFLAWNLFRLNLVDPRLLVAEREMFLVGDLSRFLSASFYVKPAWILGAMVMCGSGAILAAFGLRHLDSIGWALLSGLPLYYVLVPTAAQQTYYAWPLVPLLALLMARGTLWLERVSPDHPGRIRAAIAVCWFAGFVVAAPYTLRHDDVSLAAARAVRDVSDPDDLLVVMNMHDRGVGVGGINSTIMTLSGRRGWNVRFDSPEVGQLREQIDVRRREGARWLVTTWFTPDLDPWFSRFLPASFSRVPRFSGVPVDGRGITEQIATCLSLSVRGSNFAVMRLDSSDPPCVLAGRDLNYMQGER
jgi:dolichyl-phosphate-mannose-protein mannosyltransferase